MKVSVVAMYSSSSAEESYQYEVSSSEEGRKTGKVVRSYGEFKELRNALSTLDSRVVKFPSPSAFPAVSMALGFDDAFYRERAAALEAWLAFVVEQCGLREIDDDGVAATRDFLGVASDGASSRVVDDDRDGLSDVSGVSPSPEKFNELRLKIIQREERVHFLELENADLQDRVRELAETRAELERARLNASRDRAKLLAKCEALEKERDSLARQNEAISRRHQQLLLQIGGAQLDDAARDDAPNRPRPPPASPRRNKVCFGGC